jgi:hypothetical protein
MWELGFIIGGSYESEEGRASEYKVSKMAVEA